MPKDVNKNTASIGDAVIETVGGVIKFKKDFEAWEKKCRGANSGMKKGSLLYAVENHVTSPRRGSPNDGNSGAHTMLRRIRKMLVDRANGIFFEEDAETLEAIVNDLEGLKDDASLNPQNIVFSIPKKYNRQTGAYARGVEMENVYGHYLSTFYAKKHGTADRQKDGWVSDKENTATPPIYQALYGGNLVPVGLVDVLNKAIVDIDDQNYIATITTSKPAATLQTIPDFRKRLGRAISTARTEEGVSTGRVMRLMSGKSFKVPPTGKAQKMLSRYMKVPDLGGTITEFTIELTPAKTRKLIKDYMKSNMSVKVSPVIKSWKEVLL